MAVQSWVIVRLSDGKAVLETFDKRLAEAINLERYEVLRAGDYLARLNRQIRESS